MTQIRLPACLAGRVSQIGNDHISVNGIACDFAKFLLREYLRRMGYAIVTGEIRSVGRKGGVGRWVMFQRIVGKEFKRR